MSQSVGLNYKSRIPQFSDDASIEEALKVYHYGVDNYTSQPIPNDSIEGHFRNLDTRVSAIEQTGTLPVLKPFFIEAVSETASPNVITPQSSSTTPLTIRGVSGQTGNLQQWQNSSNTNVSIVFSDGSFSTSGYLSIGNTTRSTTTSFFVQPNNQTHKAVVVRGASSQTANLQEWQNSSGTVLTRIEPDGDIFTSGLVYSNSVEVVNLSDTQSLTNKSITIPTGEALDEFKARNVKISSSDPTGGNDGDIWLKHA